MRTESKKKIRRIRPSSALSLACLALVLTDRNLYGQGSFQGVFVFSNGSGNGGANAQIFGPDPSNPSLQQWGNTTNATLPGNTIYPGLPLSGANLNVQGWYSTNSVAGITQLLSGGRPVPGSLESILGNGYFGSPNPTIPDALPNPAYDPTYFAFTNEPLYAFLQVRVWDNHGGQYPTWDSAWNAALAGSGLAVGWSQVFWQPLTGPLDSRPWPAMPYFQSFNTFIVPEPTISILFLTALTSAAALKRHRRRLRMTPTTKKQPSRARTTG